MEAYYNTEPKYIDWEYVSEGDIIRVKSMPPDAQREETECDLLDYTGEITFKNEYPHNSLMRIIKDNGEIIPVIPDNCNWNMSNIAFIRQPIIDYRKILANQTGVPRGPCPRSVNVNLEEYDRRQQELKEYQDYFLNQGTFQFGNFDSDIRYLRSLHNN